MNPEVVFIDRRKGGDRRLDRDPCKGLPMDLYHRKRRKSTDRRATGRGIADDYFAYQAGCLGDAERSKDSHRAN